MLLVQSFTSRMPLLTATIAYRLGRRRWSSPQRCYLHCLGTLLTIKRHKSRTVTFIFISSTSGLADDSAADGGAVTVSMVRRGTRPACWPTSSESSTTFSLPPSTSLSRTTPAPASTSYCDTFKYKDETSVQSNLARGSIADPHTAALVYTFAVSTCRIYQYCSRASTSPKNAPFYGGIWTPSDTWFLGPMPMWVAR